MSIQAIRELVLRTEMTAGDMDELVQLVKFKRGQIGRNTMRQLRVGSAVSFTDRQGRVVKGVVQGLKLKNAVVTINGRNWRVPASMLTVE